MMTIHRQMSRWRLEDNSDAQPSDGQLVAFGAGMAHEILSRADDFLRVLTIFETTMMLALPLASPQQDSVVPPLAESHTSGPVPVVNQQSVAGIASRLTPDAFMSSPSDDQITSPPLDCVVAPPAEIHGASDEVPVVFRQSVQPDDNMANHHLMPDAFMQFQLSSAGSTEQMTAARLRNDRLMETDVNRLLSSTSGSGPPTGSSPNGDVALTSGASSRTACTGDAAATVVHPPTVITTSSTASVDLTSPSETELKYSSMLLYTSLFTTNIFIFFRQIDNCNRRQRNKNVATIVSE